MHESLLQLSVSFCTYLTITQAFIWSPIILQVKSAHRTPCNLHTGRQDVEEPTSFKQQHISATEASKGQQFNISCYAGSSPTDNRPPQPVQAKTPPQTSAPIVSRYASYGCCGMIASDYTNSSGANSLECMSIMHPACARLKITQVGWR